MSEAWSKDWARLDTIKERRERIRRADTCGAKCKLCGAGITVGEEFVFVGRYPGTRRGALLLETRSTTPGRLVAIYHKSCFLKLEVQGNMAKETMPTKEPLFDKEKLRKETPRRKLVR